MQLLKELGGSIDWLNSCGSFDAYVDMPAARGGTSVVPGVRDDGFLSCSPDLMNNASVD
jgi:hypothetical protein